jgi:hypothetical protein
MKLKHTPSGTSQLRLFYFKHDMVKSVKNDRKSGSGFIFFGKIFRSYSEMFSQSLHKTMCVSVVITTSGC